MFVCACPGMLYLLTGLKSSLLLRGFLSCLCHFARVGNMRDNRRQSSKSLLRIYHVWLYYAFSAEKLFKFCFSGMVNRRPLFCKILLENSLVHSFDLQYDVQFHVLFLRNVASDYPLNMSMTNPSPKRWDMQNDRSAIVLSQKIMKRNFAKNASIFEEKGCFRCSVRLRIRSSSPSCPFKND